MTVNGRMEGWTGGETPRRPTSHLPTLQYSSTPTLRSFTLIEPWGGGWDFYPRHNGRGLAFLFVDGHAEFFRADQMLWWYLRGATEWYPASAWNAGIWGK